MEKRSITRKQPSTLEKIGITAGLIAGTVGFAVLGRNAIRKMYPVEPERVASTDSTKTECGYLTLVEGDHTDGVNVYVVQPDNIHALSFQYESQLPHFKSTKNYRGLAGDSVCVKYIPRENALEEIADVYRPDSSATQPTITEPPK